MKVCENCVVICAAESEFVELMILCVRSKRMNIDSACRYVNVCAYVHFLCVFIQCAKHSNITYTSTTRNTHRSSAS